MLPAQVVIGIDLTMDQLDAAVVQKAAVDYVGQNCGDGQFAVAVAVSSRTLTEPIILARVDLPASPGVKGKLRQQALNTFGATLKMAIENRGQYPRYLFQQSRIADFFGLAGDIFDERRTAARLRKMMLISDMMEVDESRNWESGTLNAKDLRIGKVGGSVVVYGVRSRLYSDSRRWQEVRDLWTTLLDQAGIKLLAYSSMI
jgi:hypothetical protein